MSNITLKPELLSTLSFLANNLDKAELKRAVPTVDSFGQDIVDVKSLAVAMGVDEKVAAAYGLGSDNAELKASAEEHFTLGIYSPADDAYDVVHYSSDVATRNSEYKRIRMVRTTSGVRRFGQKLGTIIVTDGEQPLDAITAASQNDVPGYDKVKDAQGRSFYVGFERGQWVVRSGQTKAILYETQNRTNGQEEALYWLNEQLGGRKSPMKSEKAEFVDLETKKQRSQEAIDKLGKNGQAFRNHNGEYSYPIADVADLRNAIQAFGRAADADKGRLKSYIKKRARALGQEDLIPDDWKSDEAEIEEKDDTRSLDRHPEATNWVENTGELPKYIRAIANALIRERGFTISRAIATAVNRVKDWSVDPDVSAKTRAKALAAVAQWNALKAKNKARMAKKK